MQTIDKGNAYKVYKLTFKDGKSYIGYTGEKTIKKRVQKGYIHNKPLSKALATQPATIKILADGISKREAEQQEIKYIELYGTTDNNTGYNKSKGGAGGFYGCKLTAEQREAMSGQNSPIWKHFRKRVKPIDDCINKLKTAYSPAKALERAFNTLETAVNLDNLISDITLNEQ